MGLCRAGLLRDACPLDQSARKKWRALLYLFAKTSLCMTVVPQATENLGMVMVFTLVSAVQERLNEIVDQIKSRREEEKRRKEKEAEEAEKVCIYIAPLFEIMHQYVFLSWGPLNCLYPCTWNSVLHFLFGFNYPSPHHVWGRWPSKVLLWRSRTSCYGRWTLSRRWQSWRGRNRRRRNSQERPNLLVCYTYSWSNTAISWMEDCSGFIIGFGIIIFCLLPLEIPRDMNCW